MWVGLRKSDIAYLKKSLVWDKIGYGWVGMSKKDPKNRISFMNGPLLEKSGFQI